MKFRHLLTLFVIISTILIFPSEAKSQRVKPNRWVLRADGGVSIFFGDVKRYDYIPDFNKPSEIHPMFGASVGKEISKVFTIRGQFLYGQLGGHKKSAHYYFDADIIGGHVITDINLNYLFTNARFGDSRLNIITSLGVGYMNWNSTLFYDNPPKDSDGIMATNVGGNISFPVALSFEYILSKHFSLNLEGLLYIVNSDEVDAKPGGIKVDMINYNNLGITYKIINKKKAKRTEIKYALDPELYEPKPKDTKQEDEIVSNKQIEDSTNVIKPDIVIENENLAQQLEAEKYRINHELEKEAIKKETWADKSDNPWPEIEFSVQILATKKQLDIGKLQADYDIAEEMNVRFDGELYRYSVGKYDKMWRAKELRNILRSREGIADAFIVVYRNNERISLEEALNYVARKQVIPNEKYMVEDQAAEKIYPLVKLENSIPQSGIFIGVQVISVKNDFYPMGVFKGIYNIDKPMLVHEQSPWFKIIISDFKTYDEAYDYQYEARDKGFIDAFVVAFKDGKRITITKLKEELAK